jgi:hypothetical protein
VEPDDGDAVDKFAEGLLTEFVVAPNHDTMPVSVIDPDVFGVVSFTASSSPALTVSLFVVSSNVPVAPAAMDTDWLPSAVLMRDFSVEALVAIVFAVMSTSSCAQTPAVRHVT